jgi:hypothetical protein
MPRACFDRASGVRHFGRVLQPGGRDTDDTLHFGAARFGRIDRSIREVTSRAHASLHAMESLHAGYKARRRFTGSRQGFLDDLAADDGQAMV